MKLYKEVNTIFTHIGVDSLYHIKKNFKPVKNIEDIGTKPIGGLWCCEYISNSEYISKWDYFKTEVFNQKCDLSFNFKLKPTAKILLIESLEDAKDIQSKYPLKDNPLNYLLNMIENINADKDLFRNLINRFEKQIFIDFEKLATEYDGVFLSDYTGLSEILWGWDVESMVLNNLNCIELVKKDDL